MDKSWNRLKEDIHHIEQHLSQVGQQIKNAGESKLEVLDNDLCKAKKKYESKKEQTSDAIKRMNQFFEETKDNAINQLEDWKTDHQIHKIEKNADKKEKQAADAVLVAAFACIEAEVAIMDALKARKMAIDVAG